MVDPARTPPLPTYSCARCGWWRVGFKLGYTTQSGEQRYDDFPIADRCQRCAGPMTLVQPPRDRIMADVVSAVRSAGLSAGDLRDLAAAVDKAGPTTSPRDLARQVPQAAPVITAAARFSTTDWLTILGIVVAITIAVVQTAQPDQPPPAPARQTVNVYRTSELTDHDVSQIASQVDRDLKRRRETANEEGRKHSDDDEPEHYPRP